MLKQNTIIGMASLLHQPGLMNKKPKHIPVKTNQKSQEELI